MNAIDLVTQTCIGTEHSALAGVAVINLPALAIAAGSYHAVNDPADPHNPPSLSDADLWVTFVMRRPPIPYGTMAADLVVSGIASFSSFFDQGEPCNWNAAYYNVAP